VGNDAVNFIYCVNAPAPPNVTILLYSVSSPIIQFH